MTPGDGAAETLDLTTGFLDGASPRTVCTRAEPSYPPVMETRENVLRNERPLLLGYRPEVVFEFVITDMATHNPLLAKVASRLMDPYWTVELSMDGGITYREVVLKQEPRMRAIGGKTVAGAHIDMAVQAKKPILTYPDIGSGSSW